MKRRPLIAGNWKMHKTIEDARDFVRAFRALPLPSDVEMILCPPFTALTAVAEELDGSPIALGAQNMHSSDHGPFTGEVSPSMLREIGVTYVILGHSERRRDFCETDEGVARKVRAALAHGITPIVAVGESAEEHARDETVDRVVAQTRAALEGLASDLVATCVVAYEPIWAIGTGLCDDPASTNHVMQQIRACVSGLQDARLLYGGSMSPQSAADFLAQPNVDGGLVGGASLNPQSFADIVSAAHASLVVQ